MTNARQVREIFKPFARRDENWKEMRLRFLLRMPVRHISCGIFIERSSNPDSFWPSLVANALFYSNFRNEIRIGTYSEPLSRTSPSSTACWLWSDPTAICDAIDVITTYALPKLSLYGTIEGYSSLLDGSQRFYSEPLEDRMIVYIAAGNLDAARTIWHHQQSRRAGKLFPPGSRAHRWQMQLATVAEPLMAGDRPALAKILHDWEAANVRGTELELYWEPTPFPLER